MVSDVYQALDLSAFCNAGVEILGGDEGPPTGDQLFHGLPFRIGAGGNAFIAFDANRASLSIPITATAYSVIVAHRLIGSQLMAGAPVGDRGLLPPRLLQPSGDRQPESVTEPVDVVQHPHAKKQRAGRYAVTKHLENSALNRNGMEREDSENDEP